MPPFDECCVLIPAATLEDFPSDLSDYDARSLLAAWTVLWHPGLLSGGEQTPVWYRADAPPDPIGKRLITLPAPSLAQLPAGYQERAQAHKDCRLITGGSRDEMLEQLDLDDPKPLCSQGRRVGVEDFFAAGFAALQIQVMTRRLRYTSNLDEIHFQNRIVAAAKSFLEGDAPTTMEALHDVFDCLAEERDHYFSSDPHLIDLTLTSESTIEALLALTDDLIPAASQSPSSDEDAVLATPRNALIDCEVAEALARCEDARAGQFREALASGAIGWAGGGPAANVCLDAMTFAEAESVFIDAHRQTEQSLGTPPPVYGRFSGSTPSDLTRTLVRLGYCGMIPLDFANGTGHGDEAKVIMQSAGAELEALTAKPIDASSDASFLTIGARLGEAIDSGEIATALLAHWPGKTCDAFEDLRRVASWSLCLGRFWNLTQYFRDGERPYHHGTSAVASPQAAGMLEAMIRREVKDPISSLAAQFRQKVADECQGVIAGMTAMVTGDPVTHDDDSAKGLAAAIARPGDEAATLLINPHSVGCRDSVTQPGGTMPPAKHVFASTQQDGKTTTTVDIPACGFVVVGRQPTREGGSLGKSIRRRLFGGTKMIAEHGRLRNEFLEVTISADTGGISGVYSGMSRGNRFSMRLIRGGHQGGQQESSVADDTVMRCRELRVISSSAAQGCVETQGELTGPGGESVVAEFKLRYTLSRGSRFIQVDGEVSPGESLHGDPWQQYVACRVAVVSEAAIYRPLLRDKVHRARSRRLVAPLGILIDEAERQTLVASGGLAFHRQVGDRFLDTILLAQGESNHQFRLCYGFDVPTPVGTSRALISPVALVGITTPPAASDIGWIVHAAPKETLISSLRVGRRRDGQLAALVRVTQTRPQSCKASIRFCRDVSCALELAGQLAGQLAGPADDPLNLSLSAGNPSDNEATGNQAPTDAAALKVDGDLVSLSMPAHGVADLLVVFVGEAESP